MADKQSSNEATYEIQEPAPKRKFAEVLNRRPVKIATFAVSGALALGAAFGVGLAVGHNGDHDRGQNFSQFGGPHQGHDMGGPGQFGSGGRDGDNDHGGFKGPQGQPGQMGQAPQGQPAPNGVAPTASSTTTP